MTQTLKAIYREGAFIPKTPCDLPEGVEVELTINAPHILPPKVTDPEERKRILEVVRTAAIVHRQAPDVRFTIVGAHEDGAAAVRDEVTRLDIGTAVDLRGRVAAEEKRALMTSAAVYFQPTLYEAFGVAMAEAMACGAPVLSNAVGAVPEVVGDCGVLLPSGSTPEAYADALVKLLHDPHRERLGERGRERVNREFSHRARRRVVEEALAVVRGR